MRTKDFKKLFGFEVKSIDEKNFTVKGVFSTDDMDRHGEIVHQDGWDLEQFKKNPVILWAHDHWTPAIGKAIDVSVVDGKLQGEIQFAAGIHELATTVFELIKGGFISAFSVGFRNNTWKMDEENGVMHLLTNSLYEISVVNVPALPQALVAAAAKGINVEPMRELLGEEVIGKEAVKIEEKEITAEKATEVLSRADTETLKATIAALQEVVDVAEEKGRTLGAVKTGPKKIPVSVFNAAVRQLLKARKINNAI